MKTLKWVMGIIGATILVLLIALQNALNLNLPDWVYLFAIVPLALWLALVIIDEFSGNK